MKTQDFTTTILVSKTPQEVFTAINNVQDWWSDIEGDTNRFNAEFVHRYKDAHICKIKITEFIPGKKIVWHVLDNYFNFTKDKSEWKDTDIVFEIEKKGNETQVRFTHIGLVPVYECYETCSNAWGMLINGNLHSLLTTGNG